ncbi:MAG: outer membrane protein transport protein [Humidesulfovibrio sp.]|uniref:OmpP1/FadL family transporter n=1 Tax=Humidesulfovibrio sp. TaxID=2910988 RepID=UPI0027F66F43|nr:outer membrane protein transport protein [Humidesulfovibrio sp.]MDQ7836672.1 outer membrane protein transport protein [Humidesulfovibrio sp.]
MKHSRAKARFLIYAVTLLTLVSLPSLSLAGGFALYEYSARANAMGGATIALADDASAVAYNPAGITQLPGTRIMVGMTAIAPTADVQTANEKTTTQTNIYTPPHAFLTYQAGERAWLGLGLYTRFGVGTQYGYEWAGKSKLYRSELETYSLAANLALKLTDSLSISFGPEVMYSSGDLRTRPTGTNDQMISVSGFGIGGQLGVHYKINDEWSAGFTYHTLQKHVDKGHARFIESGVFQDGNITMSLTLPASYNLGLAYKPNSKWKFEADAIYTQWQDYKKLIYDYEKKPGTATAGVIVSEKNWRNVWRFQGGAEYQALDWLALRAGFVWDQDPVRKGYEDYMLPSSDRKIYSTGFGVTDGKFTYDVSVMYLQNNHRSIDSNSNNNVGAYEVSNSKAYMAGFSIGYTY